MNNLKLYQIPSATFVLDAPLVADDGSGQLTHYTRHCIVAAANPADALAVLRMDARREAATLLSADEPVERLPADIPHGLFKQHFTGERREVCWKSGRVFFPAA